MHLPIELVLNVVTQCLPKYDNVILAPSHPITQTLLSFTLVCHETYRLASRYLREHCIYIVKRKHYGSLVDQLRAKPDARKIPSMLVTTFSSGSHGTRPWSFDIFKYTAPHVRRLILDGGAPSHSFLECVRGLENLEELVHTGKMGHLHLEDYYRGFQVPVWKDWRRLKRLALCYVDADLEFWQDIAEIPQLETLVLTRATNLTAYNIKIAYFNHTSRPLKLLLVDVESDQVRSGKMRRMGWSSIDPERKLTIMTYNVPMLYSDEVPNEACYSYVKSGAENGTLWDWEGEVMQHLLPASTSTT